MPEVEKVKITYLLGAGASAQALPMIKTNKNEGVPITDKDKGLPECLLDFVQQYKETWSSKNINGETIPDNDMIDVLQRLESIAKECINFGTPDLYAKFLYESSPAEIRNYLLLKLLLSNYFYLKQYSDFEGRAFGHGAFDKRALTFLSTICEDGKLPNNVKIISWNYDEQIEIAGSKINSRDGMNFLASWPNQHPDYKGDYFIQHLNGIAGWDYNSKAVQLQQEFITYKNFQSVRNPLLSFAWEKKEKHDLDLFFDTRMRILQSLTEGTDILVIIGYSFPFFNRKIDKQLFEFIKPNAKIYYQDPNAIEKKDLIKNLFGIENDIVPISYLDQYYVPFEL